MEQTNEPEITLRRLFLEYIDEEDSLEGIELAPANRQAPVINTVVTDTTGQKGIQVS